MKIFDATLFTILIFFSGAYVGMIFANESVKKNIKTDLKIKIDGVKIESKIDTISSKKIIEVISSTDSTDCVDSLEYDKVELIRLKKEWFAFDNSNFKYNYDTICYSEEDLNLFADILWRESRAYFTIGQRIDQYLVAICGIQTIIGLKQHKDIHDLIYNGYSFTFPKTNSKRRKSKAWIECRKVCKNVLECNIPAYVPYVPHGTICYWNSRIDTNLKHKKRLEDTYQCVGSTVWDHHYYCYPKYMTEKERQYLFNNDKLCNPIVKNIENGIYCKN